MQYAAAEYDALLDQGISIFGEDKNYLPAVPALFAGSLLHAAEASTYGYGISACDGTAATRFL